MTLSVGSLFSGIGGLDLGLERAGFEVRWQSEIDPYCSRVLAKHWPSVPNLGDVTKVEWEHVERVDLICGGYPCQPFSLAGARRGHDDARHLWPHFAECLRVLRPRVALLENVPGHLSLGFGDVLADLASLGYDCEWECIPAAAVGAPHLRYRIFVVAYAQRDELRDQPVAVGGRSSSSVARDDGETQPLADADGRRLEERGECDLIAAGGQRASFGDDADRLCADVADTDRSRCADVQRGATLAERAGRGTVGGASPVGHTFGTSADALTEASRSWRSTSESGWWGAEPDVGRVAHGVPARVDRLRALGNAVVPQVAQFIGEQLARVLVEVPTEETQ